MNNKKILFSDAVKGIVVADSFFKTVCNGRAFEEQKNNILSFQTQHRLTMTAEKFAETYRQAIYSAASDYQERHSANLTQQQQEKLNSIIEYNSPNATVDVPRKRNTIKNIVRLRPYDIALSRDFIARQERTIKLATYLSTRNNTTVQSTKEPARLRQLSPLTA